jgi:hypothetical protein
LWDEREQLVSTLLDDVVGDNGFPAAFPYDAVHFDTRYAQLVALNFRMVASSLRPFIGRHRLTCFRGVTWRQDGVP